MFLTASAAISNTSLQKPSPQSIIHQHCDTVTRGHCAVWPRWQGEVTATIVPWTRAGCCWLGATLTPVNSKTHSSPIWAHWSSDKTASKCSIKSPLLARSVLEFYWSLYDVRGDTPRWELSKTNNLRTMFSLGEKFNVRHFIDRQVVKIVT